MDKKTTAKEVKKSASVKTNKTTKKAPKKVTKVEPKKEVETVEETETTENVEEVKETVEKQQEKVETKEKKESTIHKIYNVVFWIVIACLAFIWITDFIRVKNDKDPNFCVRKSTLTFGDGTVDVCNGLGYNVYKYNRDSIKIKAQFSPFFIGMRK